MDRATVLDGLTKVAVEVLGVKAEVVNEDASFKDDLDADSLDLVEFVMALEERFDISVPEDKLEEITTVGEAVDLVIGMAAPADGDGDGEEAPGKGAAGKGAGTGAPATSAKGG